MPGPIKGWADHGGAGMASAEPTLAGRPLAVSREASGTLDASQANGLTALPSIVLDGAAGPSVTVPDGPFLLLADYIREGADLVLVGPDGQTVVVRDYFASDAPPTLITEGGARVPPDLAEALAGLAAPRQLAQAGETTATAPIGQVQTLEGTATATRADGSEVTLDLPPRFVPYPMLVCLPSVLRPGSAAAHQQRRPERAGGAE